MPPSVPSCSTSDTLRSFSRGAVDLEGLYAVCRALANPTWLVAGPEEIPADISGTTNACHLRPLDIGNEISHVVIPVLHHQGSWTIAFIALQERRIASFQPGNRDDLHAKSFEIARRLCSEAPEVVGLPSWLEERYVCCYSPPSIEDEGICAIVLILDCFWGNPSREKIVISAWRYALGIAYAAIQGISASVVMPLAYKSHVSLHPKEPSKLVQEQAERLTQIHRYLGQAEANRDACMTLHSHLDAILQRDERCSVGKDTVAEVYGLGDPKSSRLLSELDEDVLSDSRRHLLATVRSALRTSQDDCETFVRIFCERHHIRVDNNINENTKRRRV